METIIIQTDTDKVKGLTAFLKAFGVSFKIQKPKEKPYNEEFVKMVLQSRSESGGVLLTDKYKKELFKEL